MNVLLTGCHGFIGRNLAPELRKRGCGVVGVDRRKHITDHRVVHGDLTNKHTCEQALKGIHCVMHLAAAKGDWGIAEDEYFRDNVEATRTLIEAGKNAGVKEWIFYSTVSTMGPSRGALDETAKLAPTNAYGASKAEAEKLFHDLADSSPESRILIIRPSAVYGPGNPNTTNVYRLMDAIYRGRFVKIGSGTALKSTSYIENLISATFFLMDRMQQGIHTYIYVDKPVLTTNDIVGRIYRLLDKKPPSWYLPLSLTVPVSRIADMAAEFTGIDIPITGERISKFNTSTNFDASAIRSQGFDQPVSNEQAILTTLRWHVEHVYGKTMPASVFAETD